MPAGIKDASGSVDSVECRRLIRGSRYVPLDSSGHVWRQRVGSSKKSSSHLAAAARGEQREQHFRGDAVESASD